MHRMPPTTPPMMAAFMVVLECDDDDEGTVVLGEVNVVVGTLLPPDVGGDEKPGIEDPAASDDKGVPLDTPLAPLKPVPLDPLWDPLSAPLTLFGFSTLDSLDPTLWTVLLADPVPPPP